MTIRKEDNGTYTVWHSERHPITRVPKTLKRVGLKTRSEATRVERELITSVRNGFDKSRGMRWTELIYEYAEHCRLCNISEKTINNRTVCLNALTVPLWGCRRIDSITPQMINEVINEGMLGKSQSYKRNVLKFIKLTFQYAVDQGYLALNPTPRMKFKVGDKIKRVLTSNQAAKLLNSAKFDSDWYPHWAMALYTGMRSGELYALTWDKVNFESRQIRVDCSWNSKDGFKSTKSGDERIVEIAPSLLQVLKELKLELGSSSTFVLPRMRAWDKGDQARELKKYLIGISVPPVRFHDLRATWATIMLSQGIPPIKVMKMGGWKDLKTMQIYMRMAGIDIQGVTDNLCLHNPASGTVSHLKVASFEHFPKVIR